MAVDTVLRDSGVTQTVAYTASSAATTNAFGNHINVVRLVATTDCHVAFGKSPTATADDMYIVAKIPEYFQVRPGEKVAAIRETADGELFVTEMTR